MAKTRKTISIESLKEEANRLLALPEDKYRTDEWREGIFSITAHFLNTTGNYKGFNFVKWSREGGFEQWIADGKPENNTPYLGNQTRRFFY